MIGRLLETWAVCAFAVLVAAHTSFGTIGYDSWPSLLVAAVILSFLNAFIGPLLVLLTLPLVVLTLGLGVLLINTGLFALTGMLVSGFHVQGVLGALWGAIVVGVIGIAYNRLRGRPQVNWRVRSAAGGPSRRPPPPPDVIDV